MNAASLSVPPSPSATAPRPPGRSGWARKLGLLLSAPLLWACAASIPAGKLGVTDLSIEGTEAVDPEAIKTCIATRELERFGFTLGSEVASECGTPPFEAARLPVELWAWPWTDYPIYDPAVFERDQDRVERFYRARGYYDARITATHIKGQPDDRSISISMRVQEGQPVRVTSLRLLGVAQFSQEEREAITDAIALSRGEVFDEYLYDQSKQALIDLLGEASYAHAQVEGDVRIDAEAHTASVTFAISAGMPCRFGQVRVAGYDDLSPRPMWGAAGIEPGTPFSLSALSDARQAVYALGPFAAVDVEPQLDPDSDIVDVLIRVVPGRRSRLSFGVGMEVGGNLAQGATDAGDSFAQWDLHLLSRFEHRNFLGGMRHLLLEERPRIIFDDSFPSAARPNLGNSLSVDLRQPAFGEARTALRTTVRWDLGPDPFGGRFYRSELTTGIGPERRFLGGDLRWSSTVNWHGFRELTGIDAGPIPDYDVFYFQHTLQLELRDEPRRPRQGIYAALSVIHAGYFLPGDWNYVRVVPEIRGYVPLPLGMVLAAKALLGFMQVTDTQIEVPRSDPGGFISRLARFGPLRHRLRGGGHNSVRGYRPNTLGDAVLIGNRLDSGGARRWEASVELRVPLTPSFGTVLFVDAGDVNQGRSFRWNYPQTTLGVGLRYQTIVGPLRLDVGFAPPDLQVFGQDNRIRTGIPQARIFGLADGTIHFTIGEAF